jgi:hypothetical protein
MGKSADTFYILILKGNDTGEDMIVSNSNKILKLK